MALLTLSWGQPAPYTTDIISQPYAPLEEYSLLDLGLGWDDPEEWLPIPFDMVVWGHMHVHYDCQPRQHVACRGNQQSPNSSCSYGHLRCIPCRSYRAGRE